MRFLPREEKFFVYFLEQIKIASEAASLLCNGVQQYPSGFIGVAEKIKALETRGDAVVRDVYVRLTQTFITPLDPEDLHTLASLLDDVIDGLEDTAHRIAVYRVNPLPTAVAGICSQIVACTQALDLAFHSLQSDRKIHEHCEEVMRLEESVDAQVRSAIQELFETEKDAIQVIKLKEIYDFLEATADSCEDVADALQNVVVKNS
ncbi:MAG: DUF47 family protein [Bryobacteraceae bacterium]|nr:DUF47 family protein [Bryobacteraceae bacterium]